MKIKSAAQSAINQLQAEPPAHPYFISCLILLHYFASTQLMQFPIDMIVVPLVATCVTAFGFWAILSILLRDSEKAGLIVSTCILIFYSLLIAGPLARYVPNFMGLLEPLWLVLILTIAGILVTRRGWFRASTMLNNLSASACLLLCAILMCWESYNFYVRLPKYIHQDAGVDAQAPLPVSQKPDVYYIIIDACASDAILKKLYDTDQSKYTNALIDKGFKVVPAGHSNYSMTLLSLASSLNMEYINQLEELIGPKTIDLSINDIIIRKNRVLMMLKERGYKIIHISSGFGPTWWNPWADVNLHCDYFNETVFAVMQRSIYGMFSGKSLMDQLANLRLRGFENLKNSVDIAGPKFVFAHILLPHPPYLFDADGNRVKSRVLMNFSNDDKERDKRLYVAQAEFAKKSALAAIDHILKHSKQPPIIILQSDHGPGNYGELYFHEKQSDAFVQERMGNYNALYLPGVSKDLIPDNLTPVNSFRIVFNNYFGTKYPLLENKIYLSSYATPFDFIDVTKQLEKK